LTNIAQLVKNRNNKVFQAHSIKLTCYKQEQYIPNTHNFFINTEVKTISIRRGFKRRRNKQILYENEDVYLVDMGFIE